MIRCLDAPALHGANLQREVLKDFGYRHIVDISLAHHPPASHNG
jgi:hypothetical protein